MANEVAAIDSNNKPSVTFVTDDSNQFIKRGRIDDATKGLKVMLIGGTGTGTVTSITAGTGLTASPNPIISTGTISLDSKLSPLDTLGTAGQSVRVNAGATALEYYTPAAGGITIGTTTITSGTTTRILYDNAGVVGEYTITGTGTVVAMATSPSFTTPVLGIATATSINKVAFTAPATSATLTIADGKTLTVSDSTTLSTNAITLAGGEVITFSATNALSLLTTGTSVMTFPTTTDTVATLAATQTLTNKRVTPRVVTTTQSATPTINTDNGDVFNITGLAQAITSMTTNLSGTPTAYQPMRICITDNGTARAITWGASFESSTVALPSTTVISTLLTVGFFWNTVTSKWTCVAVA